MARCLAVAISQAPGLSGTPVARPLLQRGDERVLRELLGEPDVAHHPRQAGDQARGLDPPDRLDGALRWRLAAQALSRRLGRRGWIGRTSITSPSRAGQRAAHSTASSFEDAWMTQ